MRRTHKNQETTTESINLTPLIDMVFILLIFFLVTSSFTKESGIDVNRPKAQTATRQEHASIIIGIDENGEIWIDNKNIELRSVRALIEYTKSQNPEGKIVILADENVETGVTVEVLDQVRLAGITNVSIAATN